MLQRKKRLLTGLIRPDVVLLSGQCTGRGIATIQHVPTSVMHNQKNILILFFVCCLLLDLRVSGMDVSH
jgi:hypothetical protein